MAMQRELLKHWNKKMATVPYPFEKVAPPEGLRGKHEYEQEKCIGCGLCTEVCAFSAIKNNDKVGLIVFTDIVEMFVPPAKGTTLKPVGAPSRTMLGCRPLAMRSGWKWMKTTGSMILCRSAAPLK